MNCAEGECGPSAKRVRIPKAKLGQASIDILADRRRGSPSNPAAMVAPIWTTDECLVPLWSAYQIFSGVALSRALTSDNQVPATFATRRCPPGVFGTEDFLGIIMKKDNSEFGW